jgi:hypothetical protein
MTAGQNNRPAAEALDRAPVPDLEAASRQQRRRSIAIALALGALVVLFYAATMVRLGKNVVNRPLTSIFVLAPVIVGSGSIAP